MAEMMTMKGKSAVLILLVFFSSSFAMAQMSKDDSLGIRAGAFLIKPELKLGHEYNDNIYATDEDTVSDWITTVAPKLAVNSDWSRHALGITTGFKSSFYSSRSDENHTDAQIKLDGRLDFLRESFLTGQAGLQYLHEARSDPDSDLSWAEPATYYRSNGNIDYYHGAGKFSATAGAGIIRMDYSSVELISGGSQNLNNRDYNTYDVSFRFAYEMHPVVRPFVSTGYEWRRYDESEVGRDSQGYRIGLGTAFDLGGITSCEVFAGYMEQEYDDRSNIQGPWYGMSLLWNITGLTSVKGTVKKSIKETTLEDSSGIDGLDVNLRVDHELLRNLLLGAFFDYTYNSYQDVDISDRYYDLGPRLTYLWNQNLSAEIEYTSYTCVSNQDDREFDENRFVFSITGKL